MTFLRSTAETPGASRPLLAAAACLLSASCGDTRHPPLSSVPPRPAFEEGERERAELARELADEARELEREVAEIRAERGEGPTVAPPPPAQRPVEAAQPAIEPIPPFSSEGAVELEADGDQLGEFLDALENPARIAGAPGADRLTGRGLAERVRTWIDGAPAPCPPVPGGAFLVYDALDPSAGALEEAIARCGRRDVVVLGVGPSFEDATDQARAAQAAWLSGASGRVRAVRIARRQASDVRPARAELYDAASTEGRALIPRAAEPSA